MTNRMPVLFIGHGSPMNAIEDNEFSRAWTKAGKGLPAPKAILCISAHWETKGTQATGMEKPRTIHDFYGFPPELYEMRYPAPGAPELAQRVREMGEGDGITADLTWGLDHGTWSVLSRLFPKADVPVVQLSLDMTKNAQAHYDLGRQMRSLRDEGVLILGSGNIVHNLGMVVFEDTATTGRWNSMARSRDGYSKTKPNRSSITISREPRLNWRLILLSITNLYCMCWGRRRRESRWVSSLRKCGADRSRCGASGSGKTDRSTKGRSDISGQSDHRRRFK